MCVRTTCKRVRRRRRRPSSMLKIEEVKPDKISKTSATIKAAPQMFKGTFGLLWFLSEKKIVCDSIWYGRRERMAYLRYSFDDECVCVCAFVTVVGRPSIKINVNQISEFVHVRRVWLCIFFLIFFCVRFFVWLNYCCCIVSIELNSVLEFAFTPDPHDMHSLFGANAPNSLLMTMTMIFETHTPKTYIFVFTRLCCVFNLSQATIVLLLGFSVFAQFILFQIFFSFFLFLFLQQF